MPLVLQQFQRQDPILVATLEEAMASCDSAEVVAWKLISSSVGGFSGTQEYWLTRELVAKVFDPSRTSKSGHDRSYVIAVKNCSNSFTFPP